MPVHHGSERKEYHSSSVHNWARERAREKINPRSFAYIPLSLSLSFSLNCYMHEIFQLASLLRRDISWAAAQPVITAQARSRVRITIWRKPFSPLFSLCAKTTARCISAIFRLSSCMVYDAFLLQSPYTCNNKTLRREQYCFYTHLVVVLLLESVQEYKDEERTRSKREREREKESFAARWKIMRDYLLADASFSWCALRILSIYLCLVLKFFFFSFFYMLVAFFFCFETFVQFVYIERKMAVGYLHVYARTILHAAKMALGLSLCLAGYIRDMANHFYRQTACKLRS